MTVFPFLHLCDENSLNELHLKGMSLHIDNEYVTLFIAPERRDVISVFLCFHMH